MFLGKNKYPLIKTKIFHNDNQDSPVLLPSEYKATKQNTILKFKYNFVFDSVIEVFEEDTKFYAEITVLKPEKKGYPYFDGTSFLRNIEDTLFLSDEEFKNLIPFIKSNKKKILFCASKVDKIYNDTITIASHSYITNGKILWYWQDYMRHDEKEMLKLKESTFILRELYYTRGNATFYLDKKFVIKIK